MKDRSAIFRPEAVESRARAQAPGGVVKLGPRWTRWAFWVLLGLVAAALVAGSQIEIKSWASGVTASDPGGRLVVLIPAGAASTVPPGRDVELGPASTKTVSGNEILTPTEAQERYGVAVAQESLVVRTDLEAVEDIPATARVFLDSEPVLVALVPGLKALFGGD